MLANRPIRVVALALLILAPALAAQVPSASDPPTVSYTHLTLPTIYSV